MRYRTAALSILLGLAVPRMAFAIPAFARRYGTSCLTCHTVYPKLTPFGEAFRRNGYRFPGVDTDYVKVDQVPLGQEAQKKTFPNAVWPASLPGNVPIAVGFNGFAVAHPDQGADGAVADNHASFNADQLVAEMHVWAGGSYDDTTTYWGEATFAGGGADIERGQVIFSDLIGPKHAVNLAVGRAPATLSSFAPHSTYGDPADSFFAAVPVTAMFGATSDSWNLVDPENGAELNGVLAQGRLDWSLGLATGTRVDVRGSENVYAHLGYKIGGMRLDGEGSTGPADTKRPWAETSLTLDVFGYHSDSNFQITPAAPAPIEDIAQAFGGDVRAQLGSLEFDAGSWLENHEATPPGAASQKAAVLTQFGEVSYVLYPWLVPNLRVQYVQITPEGAPNVNDLIFVPGVSALVRPNLKLVLAGQFETVHGAPAAGWGAIGGLATPGTPTTNEGLQAQAVTLYMATAF